MKKSYCKINIENVSLAIRKWKDKEKGKKKFNTKKDYDKFLSKQLPNPKSYVNESDYLNDISNLTHVPKWYFINDKPIGYKNMQWINLKKLLFYRNKWVTDRWMLLSNNQQQKYKSKKRYYKKVLLKLLPKEYEKREDEDDINPTIEEIKKINVPIPYGSTTLLYDNRMYPITDYNVKNSGFVDARFKKIKKLSYSLYCLLEELKKTTRWYHGHTYQEYGWVFDEKKIKNFDINFHDNTSLDVHIKKLRKLGVRIVRRHYHYDDDDGIRDRKMINSKYLNHTVPLYNVYEFAGAVIHDMVLPTILINGMISYYDQKEVLIKGLNFLKRKKNVLFDIKEPDKKRLQFKPISDKQLFNNLIEYIGHRNILYELANRYDINSYFHRDWQNHINLTTEECDFLKNNMYKKENMKKCIYEQNYLRF